MKRASFGVLGALVAISGLVGPASAANLLVNPGFEDPILAGGDVFGAPGWEVFGGGTFTIKLAPRSGDNAFKTFGVTSGAYQQFAASPGQLWEASAWVLNPSFDQMAGEQIATVNIEWRDAADQLIFPEFGAPLITSMTPAGDSASDYIQVGASGVAPAGTAIARFVLLTGAFAGPGGGAPFFDDASFQLVPEPGTLALIGLATGVVLVRRRRV